MRRPIYVRQLERHPVDAESTFWYTVSRGGEPILVSETYRERSKAIRGARATIALFSDEFVVEFSYWTGRFGAALIRTERIR